MADSKANIIISAVDNTKVAIASVKSGLNTIESAGSTLNNVIGRLAPLLGAATLTGIISESARFADGINDVAKANEVAVGSVLKLSQALSLNGGEAANASKLFDSLTQNIDEAAQGSESAQNRFKLIGISLKDLATLDGQQLFEKTLAGLIKIEDPVKRNALAMDILGKSAKGVDIKGLADDYANNQGNFDNAEKSFKDIGIAMDKLDQFTFKASQSLAETFAPALSTSVGYVDELIFGFDKLEQNIRAANKARKEMDGAWKPAASINDKPAFGSFNLPAEYQAGARREVIDPKDKAVTSNIKKIAESGYAREYAQDLATLMRSFQQATAPAQTLSEKLQDQLNAYTALDPSVKSYLQGIIDQTSAMEALAAAQKEDEKYRQDLRAWDIEQAEIEQAHIDVISEKAQTVLEVIDPTIKLREEQDLLNEAVERGYITQDQMNAYLEKTLDSAKSAQGYMKDLGATFSSAFEDAIVGGKKFSDVLSGLAQDIERILTRKAITDPLMKGLESMVIDPLSNAFGSFFANANGGVYSGAGISAYSGKIVSSPTVFPFAKGIGLMGEAGPEAIMPLRRGADGKLGVAGGGSNVTVNVFEAPGTKANVQQEQGADGQLNIKVMVEQLYGMMGRDISRGTGLAPVIERRYGLNRVSGGA